MINSCVESGLTCFLGAESKTIFTTWELSDGRSSMDSCLSGWHGGNKSHLFLAFVVITGQRCKNVRSYNRWSCRCVLLQFFCFTVFFFFSLVLLEYFLNIGQLFVVCSIFFIIFSGNFFYNIPLSCTKKCIISCLLQNSERILPASWLSS